MDRGARVLREEALPPGPRVRGLFRSRAVITRAQIRAPRWQAFAVISALGAAIEEAAVVGAANPMQKGGSAENVFTAGGHAVGLGSRDSTEAANKHRKEEEYEGSTEH